MIRSISVSIGGTGPVAAQLYLGSVPVYQNMNIPVNGFAEWHGHQVGNAGEHITTYLSGGQAWVLVSGYLLIDDGP